MTDKIVYTIDDVLESLDKLFQDRKEQWWDVFFSDRDNPCPFLVERKMNEMSPDSELFGKDFF